MKAYKSFRYRIYPNKYQKYRIIQNFGCCRFVYNYFINLQKTNYENGGSYISYNSMAKELPELKKKYNFLMNADSASLQLTLMHLDMAYKRFFKMPNIGYPKYKTKKEHYKSYSTSNNRNNIRIENNKIRIPKFEYIKIKQHRPIPANYILKSMTVEQTPSGKFFVVLLFEYEKQVIEKEVVNTIGLDYASKGLFIDSNGVCSGYPSYYKSNQAKLTFEQRKLSRMQKGSKNWEKQRIRVSKVHEKIVNQRHDFLNKESKRLAEEYDLIGIEDLDLKTIANKFNLAKATMDNGWGIFTKMLAYKLSDRGGHLVKVSRTFPSSQICNKCGHQSSITKDISIRTWTCPNCNSVHNRDHNAAINIQNEAKRLLFA